MKVISGFFLFLALTITSTYASGQENDENNLKLVLQKSITDSTFIFGKWTENGGMETHLKYLGQVTTRHGRTFKILNYIWVWGLAHRATSRILIFNENNQYVGDYYISMPSYLPTRMRNGNLIFENSDEDCDKHLVTTLNLKNGLPKQFFRKCKGEYGDIFSFESN